MAFHRVWKRIFIIGVRNDIAYTYVFPEPTHGPTRNKPFRTQQEVSDHRPEWPVGDFQTKEFHGHYLTRNRKKNLAEL